MNLRTKTSEIRFSNLLSCGFSRLRDKGRSSLSTTPLTKRIQSGSKSLGLLSISTFCVVFVLCVLRVFCVYVFVCLCVCVGRGGGDGESPIRTYAGKKGRLCVCLCVCLCILMGGSNVEQRRMSTIYSQLTFREYRLTPGSILDIPNFSVWNVGTKKRALISMGASVWK